MWLLISVITCRCNVTFNFCGCWNARTNHYSHQNKAEAILYIECGFLLFLYSISTSHLIQFEAKFHMIYKQNPHCTLNVAAVTIVTNPYNPHRTHVWKTWYQKSDCDLNVVFTIYIIQIICFADFSPDFVDHADHLTHR